MCIHKIHTQLMFNVILYFSFDDLISYNYVATELPTNIDCMQLDMMLSFDSLN